MSWLIGPMIGLLIAYLVVAAFGLPFGVAVLIGAVLAALVQGAVQTLLFGTSEQSPQPPASPRGDLPAGADEWDALLESRIPAKEPPADGSDRPLPPFPQPSSVMSGTEASAEAVQAALIKLQESAAWLKLPVKGRSRIVIGLDKSLVIAHDLQKHTNTNTLAVQRARIDARRGRVWDIILMIDPEAVLSLEPKVLQEWLMAAASPDYVKGVLAHEVEPFGLPDA